MLERLDSKIMSIFQDLNDFMEEHFDWWERLKMIMLFYYVGAGLILSASFFENLCYKYISFSFPSIGYDFMLMYGLGLIYFLIRIKMITGGTEPGRYLTIRLVFLLIAILCAINGFFLLPSIVSALPLKDGYDEIFIRSSLVTSAGFLSLAVAFYLSDIKQGKKGGKFKKWINQKVSELKERIGLSGGGKLAPSPVT